MEILKYGPKEGSVVNISLHGFPGVHSKQNREIAEVVAQVTGHRTEVFLYSGLGVAPGTFSFRNCIREVESRIDEILNESTATKIRLIGHSWGGYLALRMACIYASRLEKLVLMSPLLEFPGEEAAREGLKAYQRDYPFLNLGDIEKLALELSTVASENSPYDLVASLPKELVVLFLQAKNDEITPEANALKALEYFKRPPVFELVETDHSFVENRPRIARRIAEFLAGSSLNTTAGSNL